MAITKSIDKGVCQIGIDRQEKRNTLDIQHCLELTKMFAEAEQDPEVKAVVLCGLSNVFCPGLDIKEASATPELVFGAFDDLIRQLDSMTKPLLAAVNGPAVAQGVELLYHFDIVYCSDHSLFSMPNLALGLTPSHGTSLLAVRNGNYKLAAQKMLLSEPISPAEAVALGIVNHVLDDEKVLGQAVASAARLATMPPKALKETKRLLKASYFEGVEAAQQREQEIFEVMLGDEENKEAIDAFLENRKPVYNN